MLKVIVKGRLLNKLQDYDYSYYGRFDTNEDYHVYIDGMVYHERFPDPSAVLETDDLIWIFKKCGVIEKNTIFIDRFENFEILDENDLIVLYNMFEDTNLKIEIEEEVN